MDEHKMQELRERLESAVSEEANDSEKYMEMAMSAPEQYASILSQIAEEERIHHKHLLDILWDIQKWMCMHEADSPNQK